MIYGTQGEGLDAELLRKPTELCSPAKRLSTETSLARELPLPGALLFLLELQQRLFRQLIDAAQCGEQDAP